MCWNSIQTISLPVEDEGGKMYVKLKSVNAYGPHVHLYMMMIGKAHKVISIGRIVSVRARPLCKSRLIYVKE